jgi:thiol-disulfide isomerase/thioredoxin
MPWITNVDLKSLSTRLHNSGWKGSQPPYIFAVFYSETCPVCKKAIVILRRMYKEAEDTDRLNVLLINAENPEVSQFLKYKQGTDDVQVPYVILYKSGYFVKSWLGITPQFFEIGEIMANIVHGQNLKLSRKQLEQGREKIEVADVH